MSSVSLFEDQVEVEAQSKLNLILKHREQKRPAIGPAHLLVHSSKLSVTDVVYFDQRMHACACIRIVENDKKTFENDEKVPFSSCV